MDTFNGLYSGREINTYCKRMKIKSFEKYQRILDVGSGFSITTSQLIKMGGNAFAIDIGYSDINKMIERYMNQSSKIYYEIVLKDPKNIISLREKNIADFKSSIKENPGKYIAGDCLNLPFKDGFFDLAINIESLGREKYFSYENFLKGVDEMTRVSREVRISSKKLHKYDHNLEELINKKGLKIYPDKNLLIIK